MNRSARAWAANLGVFAIGAGCFVLRRYPPTQFSFYPRCPFFTFLHLRCPGCGATRAMAALMHGRIAEGFHLNPLFIAMLPFILCFLAVCYWRAIRHDEFRWPGIPDSWLKGALVLVLAFTVVRNIAGL